jgi:hypothetical protein
MSAQFRGNGTRVMFEPADVIQSMRVNARDAMPNGGRFRVEARNLTFHPGGAASEGLIGDFLAMTSRTPILV